ncbi:MAG: hypothetical protein U0736_06065 [Gemmataceae bacterium]
MSETVGFEAAPVQPAPEHPGATPDCRPRGTTPAASTRCEGDASNHWCRSGWRTRRQRRPPRTLPRQAFGEAFAVAAIRRLRCNRRPCTT